MLSWKTRFPKRFMFCSVHKFEPDTLPLIETLLHIGQKALRIWHPQFDNDVFRILELEGTGKSYVIT